MASFAGLSCKVVLSVLPQSWQKRLKYLKKIYEKTIKSTLQVSFLQRCVSFEVVPKFLHFKVPSHLRAVSTGIRNCLQRALRKSLARAKKESQEKIEDLRAAKLSMTDEERRILQPLLDSHAVKTEKVVSKRHRRKLDCLIQSQNNTKNTNSPDLKFVSANFSDTII